MSFKFTEWHRHPQIGFRVISKGFLCEDISCFLKMETNTNVPNDIWASIKILFQTTFRVQNRARKIGRCVCVGGGERQDSNKPLACRHQSQQGHLTPFCKQDQQDKQLVENISLSFGWPDPLSQTKPQLSLDLYDESYFWGHIKMTYLIFGVMVWPRRGYFPSLKCIL